MADKITLTGVWRNDKDKAGNPLVSKQGKPYTRLSVKAKEYGDKYISGFAGDWNASWKTGDVVACEIKPNGEYLNLEKPSPLADFAKTIMALSVRVGKIESRVEMLEKRPDNIPVIQDSEDVPPPTDKDMPF